MSLSPGQVFDIIEIVCVAIFIIEYFARLWCVVEDADKKYQDELWGRLHFMISWCSIVDLCAIVPSIVTQVLDKPTNLSFFRLIRLTRLLKTEKIFHGLDSLGRVLYSNRDMLTVGMTGY